MLIKGLPLTFPVHVEKPTFAFTLTSLKKEAWPALSIVHEKNNEKLNKDYRFIRAELELFHILESDFVRLCT